MLRSAESDHPKIISREVISDELKRHRPTDRRATCRSNTALSAASRSKNEARRWKNFDYTFSRFGTIPACTVIHKLSSYHLTSSVPVTRYQHALSGTTPIYWRRSSRNCVTVTVVWRVSDVLQACIHHSTRWRNPTWIRLTKLCGTRTRCKFSVQATGTGISYQ